MEAVEAEAAAVAARSPRSVWKVYAAAVLSFFETADAAPSAPIDPCPVASFYLQRARLRPGPQWVSGAALARAFLARVDAAAAAAGAAAAAAAKRSEVLAASSEERPGAVLAAYAGAGIGALWADLLRHVVGHTAGELAAAAPCDAAELLRGIASFCRDSMPGADPAREVDYLIGDHQDPVREAFLRDFVSSTDFLYAAAPPPAAAPPGASFTREPDTLYLRAEAAYLRLLQPAPAPAQLSPAERQLLRRIAADPALLREARAILGAIGGGGARN
jgi:hypothetical protein